MQSLWIVQKDIMLLLRNKKTFLMLLLMPLILIAILGLSLSNLFGDEEDVQSIAKFQVAVIDEDRTKQSKEMLDEVLQVYLQSYVSVVELERNELVAAMQNSDISTAIIIPAGFGESKIQQLSARVELISMQQIEASIIESALIQYDAMMIGISAAMEVVHAYSVPTENSGANEAGLTPQLHASERELIPFSEITALGTTKTISSFQYYAVAMGVMFLLFTVITLVSAMLEEKGDAVYTRQLTTGMLAWQYMLGKFITILLVCFIQLTIMISVTAMIYGVDWGDSMGAIIITMISFTVSTSGLGVFIASFMKREQTFDSLGMIGTQIMSALGGSFVPIYVFPEWMAMIGKVLPNSLALQMFLKVMTGGNVASIINEAVIATAIGLLLLAIAWLRMARKGGDSSYA